MKKYVGFGAELTLLELIIAIGLFAVFAALNLRIFAETQRLQKESDRLSQAVIAVESAAECFKAGETPNLCYDSDWFPTDINTAEYIVTVETSVGDGVETARISVADNSNELFAVTAKAFKEALP